MPEVGEKILKAADSGENGAHLVALKRTMQNIHDSDAVRRRAAGRRFSFKLLQQAETSVYSVPECPL
jgi:hypothetical protein